MGGALRALWLGLVLGGAAIGFGAVEPAQVGAFVRGGAATEPVAGAIVFRRTGGWVALADLVAGTTAGKASPEAGRALQRDLEAMARSYRESLRALKLEDDLATAVAFALVSMKGAVEEISIGEAEMRAVTEDVRAALNRKEIAALSDREKQTLYESFLFFGLMPIALSGVEGLSREGLDFADETFRSVFGVETKAARIGSDGLSFRR